MPDRKPPRWPTHMGRWSVPRRVFDAAPQWMHDAADWAGGIEPTPLPRVRWFLAGALTTVLAAWTVHLIGVAVVRARHQEGSGA